VAPIAVKVSGSCTSVTTSPGWEEDVLLGLVEHDLQRHALGAPVAREHHNDVLHRVVQAARARHRIKQPVALNRQRHPRARPAVAHQRHDIADIAGHADQRLRVDRLVGQPRDNRPLHLGRGAAGHLDAAGEWHGNGAIARHRLFGDHRAA
jgi:hypothetical protein